MGKIDDACKRIVDGLDGAAACGVIDLDSGLLLGIFNTAGYATTLNDVVAAATMELFRGANVSRVEQMVRRHRGAKDNGEHYFEEVQMTSKSNHHFAKTIKEGRAVVMLVTRRSTNAGMGWSQLRAALSALEAAIP
jgi:hypothetical protein